MNLDISQEEVERLVRAGLTRRDLIKLVGGGTAAIAGIGPLLAACGATTSSGSSGASGPTFKIGYVTAETGPYAEFGQADKFVIDQITALWKNGVPTGGGLRPVQIIVKDSQSSSSQAAAAAQDLINSSQIDLMLVSSTPDTTNPVGDQCEASGVPCLSSVAPWQPWFFGRKGDPAKGFKWTYHFFWGLEDIIAVFEDMWSQIPNNRRVAAFWPNDPDGNAWGDSKLGFPPALTSAGYSITDPGRYTTASPDFSTQIGKYLASGCDILTGVPIPPDMITMYKQAAQQGFKPKIASVGKALLFPSTVEALGDLGNGVSTELWWSPRHPFSSSLTQESCKQLADAFTQSTGKQWTQPIGHVHALFEVTANALARVSDPTNPASLRDAIKSTDMHTIVGPIKWTGQPVPNVAKTPLAGAQWQPGTTYKYELAIVSNKGLPALKVDRQLRAIGA